MKLTLLRVGAVPASLSARFPNFDGFFETMFGAVGAGFSFESIAISEGAGFPDPASLEGIVIPGSAFGVYDTPDWMEPLRGFIRGAYTARTPMLGVCFGHQIIADALGGTVRKSEKGWGLGRHLYTVTPRHPALAGLGDEIALAASHQDQVIVPPPGTEVFLANGFAPNAGLIYDNGATISVQPHPEFPAEFSRALIDLRRTDPLPDAFIADRWTSLDAPLDNMKMAAALATFLNNAGERK